MKTQRSLLAVGIVLLTSVLPSRAFALGIHVDQDNAGPKQIHVNDFVLIATKGCRYFITDIEKTAGQFVYKASPVKGEKCTADEKPLSRGDFLKEVPQTRKARAGQRAYVISDGYDCLGWITYLYEDGTAKIDVSPEPDALCKASSAYFMDSYYGSRPSDVALVQSEIRTAVAGAAEARNTNALPFRQHGKFAEAKEKLNKYINAAPQEASPTSNGMTDAARELLYTR